MSTRDDDTIDEDLDDLVELEHDDDREIYGSDPPVDRDCHFPGHCLYTGERHDQGECQFIGRELGGEG